VLIHRLLLIGGGTSERRWESRGAFAPSVFGVGGRGNHTDVDMVTVAGKMPV